MKKEKFSNCPAPSVGRLSAMELREKKKYARTVHTYPVMQKVDKWIDSKLHPLPYVNLSCLLEHRFVIIKSTQPSYVCAQQFFVFFSSFYFYEILFLLSSRSFLPFSSHIGRHSFFLSCIFIKSLQHFN